VGQAWPKEHSREIQWSFYPLTTISIFTFAHFVHAHLSIAAHSLLVGPRKFDQVCGFFTLPFFDCIKKCTTEIAEAIDILNPLKRKEVVAGATYTLPVCAHLCADDPVAGHT
jgi:hypothetical protein